MGKIYGSREVIQILKADDWQEVRTTGSHHHFKHPKKIWSSHHSTPTKTNWQELFNSIMKQAVLKGNEI
jgi:predicted RNA binding protein YcfA (HicA-like mRNA interferase family)